MHDKGGLPPPSADDRRRVFAHYERAMPWLERHFGGTPIIATTFPDGFGGERVFHESFDDLPRSIETVSASTSSGQHAFVKLTASNVQWLLQARSVVELHGWGPTLDDPDRAAFARLVLSPHGALTEGDVFAAAHRVRDVLAEEHRQAIPVLDGFRGLTLWIPFSDGPPYDVMAHWLRDFADELVTRLPKTFTVANLRDERGDRVYLGTKSNHPGNCSLLPYAVRGTAALEVSLPVRFSDLGKVRNGEVDASGFAEYMKLFGDVFEAERARIGQQPFFGDR